MPTVRQTTETVGVFAGDAYTAPVIESTPQRPLMLVLPGTSAIEYIVATARPGEVIHVSDAEYYNPHLWQNYSDD
jgi:hypothetical protein